ncbi:hypothetical protein D9M68_617690 [compost metagenome]
MGVADHVDGAVSDTEAASRQADLSQHRGEGHQHPERLLAMVGALQRPGNIEHGPGRRHLARKRRDACRRQAGDAGRPLCGLGLSVLLSTQVGGKAAKAHAVALQEGGVMQAFDEQGMRQTHHQRGVGVGAYRQPFESGARVQVVANRADVDKARARGGHPAQGTGDLMLTRAAGADLRVLGRHAAEGNEQGGMPGQHIPGGVDSHQFIHGGHDMRHQHACGSQAVGIGVAHIAADGVQEAVDLALGMMKAPGAGPAV